MAFQLVTEHSIWLLPLCLILAAALAALLYYRNTSDDFSTGLKWLLSVFRFLSAGTIAFLLLSPLIRTSVRTVEKPIILLAADNSHSMVLGPDSLEVRKKLADDFEKLENQLGDKFQVEPYTYGDKVQPGDSLTFADKKTDISALIRELKNRYYNRNIGALVLVSDGIYNAGSDPSYMLGGLTFPVYTVNTGDTTQHRDLLIKHVNYNKIAYKGNRFPVEVLVQALEASGERSRITVKHNGTEIFSQEIHFSSDRQVISVPLSATADQTGTQRYSIAVSPVADELNTSNNVRDIIIEVREKKQKVAIVGSSPHPDLAALKSAIGNSNNFETDLYFADNLPKKPSDYSLFILHQLPAGTHLGDGLLKEINRLNIPVLYILGSQSDIAGFNNQMTGLSLSGFNNTFNEALPVFNTSFPLFISSDKLRELLKSAPPLYSPFAKYSLNNSAYTLAYQEIGTAVTGMPLIFFDQNTDRRVGVIAGEGIWRWRMADYSLNGDFVAFNELVTSMVQFLSVTADKSRFRISAREYYAENEPIEIGASLLNETDEPVNDRAVKLSVFGEDNKKYTFEFSPYGEGYLLNAGNFPPGIYSYEGQAETGTGTLTQRGTFSVTALNLENMNLVADHRLLNTMASLTGGSAVTLNQMLSLPAIIKNRGDVKPVIYSRTRFTDLVSFFPLLMLIVGFLGLEWFLRKFHGSY